MKRRKRHINPNHGLIGEISNMFSSTPYLRNRKKQASLSPANLRLHSKALDGATNDSDSEAIWPTDITEIGGVRLVCC